MKTAAQTSPSEHLPSYSCPQHPGGMAGTAENGRKSHNQSQNCWCWQRAPTRWSECPTAWSILPLPELHSRRSCLHLELRSAFGAPTRAQLLLRCGKERPDFQQGSAQWAGRDAGDPRRGTWLRKSSCSWGGLELIPKPAGKGRRKGNAGLRLGLE